MAYKTTKSIYKRISFPKLIWPAVGSILLCSAQQCLEIKDKGKGMRVQNQLTLAHEKQQKTLTYNTNLTSNPDQVKFVSATCQPNLSPSRKSPQSTSNDSPKITEISSNTENLKNIYQTSDNQIVQQKPSATEQQTLPSEDEKTIDNITEHNSNNNQGPPPPPLPQNSDDNKEVSKDETVLSSDTSNPRNKNDASDNNLVPSLPQNGINGKEAVDNDDSRSALMKAINGTQLKKVAKKNKPKPNNQRIDKDSVMDKISQMIPTPTNDNDNKDEDWTS